ncbi:MAG: hypothetical protein DRN64_01130, partial [Thaumarchaeota archaeon]
MPKLDQAMEYGTIGAWLKKEGDKVEKGEVIVEIYVEKATFGIEAERSGYLRKILHEEGETVKVGEAIAYLADSMDEPIPEEKPAEEKAEVVAPPPEAKPEERVEIKASPRARKLAQELGIDLSKVKGTGPGGRITEKDVLAYAKQLEKERKEEEYELIPLSHIRRVTARRMAESKKTIPHYYVGIEVDASELVKLRQTLIPEVEKIAGVRLGYDDLIIKAVALALKEFPILNSSYEDDKVKVFSRINVCAAMAIGDELVTPVIRDADKKRISEIARERSELMKKAQEHKLEIEELRGGTFTVSNVGAFGVDWLAAVINPPQAAILSVASIKDKP